MLGAMVLIRGDTGDGHDTSDPVILRLSWVQNTYYLLEGDHHQEQEGCEDH